MTKLVKPLRCAITIEVKVCTLTIDQLGLRVLEKGRRNGV